MGDGRYIYLQVDAMKSGMENVKWNGEKKKGRGCGLRENLRQLVRTGGMKAVQNELRWLARQQPSFKNFAEKENAPKNRYSNIILYDHSRVVLKDGLGGDYIHASYGNNHLPCDL